jgi:hypothetical protein
MVDHNQIVDKLKEIGSNNNMDNIAALQGDKLVVEDFVLLVDLLIVVCQLTVDY